MTTTQQQILDELFRLLSCPNRWAHTKRNSSDWIHTGKVFVKAHKEIGPRDPWLYTQVEVGGVPWDAPSGCMRGMWEAAHPIFEKLVKGSTSSNEDLILEFLKTAA